MVNRIFLFFNKCYRVFIRIISRQTAGHKTRPISKSNRVICRGDNLMAGDLNKLQFKFTHDVALLILFAERLGYTLTFGEAFAYPEDRRHIDNSNHYRRLAIDLNLFKDGKYLKKTEDHKVLGEFWEMLGNAWGGRIRDGNHYSIFYKGVI